MGWSDAERKQIQHNFHEKMLWTRFITVILGIWLLTSPHSFGYEHQNLTYSDWISGALLVFFGFISMFYRFRRWFWAGCLVGVWLQMAPLVFWAKEPVIYVNDTLIGILAIAFAILVPLRPSQLEIGPQIPPGWSYNPSTWMQRIPIIFFALVGWFTARYMAAFQLGYIDHVWDPFFGGGTQKVISSIISKDFPVSDAGLGALAYSLETIMAAKGGARRWHTMPWLVVIFGLLVVPLGFVTIILVMLQPIAVGAWCGLCLIIATCMLIMLALTVDEVVAVCQYLKKVRQEKRPFWICFFKGSRYDEDIPDTRAIQFRDPFFKVLRAMTWGLQVPFNLFLTALCGIWVLFSAQFFAMPKILSNSMDVLGALIIVFSIISWAEVARRLRYLNMFLAILLIIAPFLLGFHSHWTVIINNLLTAIILITLSKFRGKIKEKYGTWDKMIK